MFPFVWTVPNLNRNKFKREIQKIIANSKSLSRNSGNAVARISSANGRLSGRSSGKPSGPLSASAETIPSGDRFVFIQIQLGSWIPAIKLSQLYLNRKRISSVDRFSFLVTATVLWCPDCPTTSLTLPPVVFVWIDSSVLDLYEYCDARHKRLAYSIMRPHQSR